ncbi:MAG TPA: hypothetical protein VJ036_07655 [bacterium]|nr:hypothetical protein [bacterium]
MLGRKKFHNFMDLINGIGTASYDHSHYDGLSFVDGLVTRLLGLVPSYGQGQGKVRIAVSREG